YSSSTGSLTLRIISACAHTSSTDARVACSRAYSSSRKLLPLPALRSTTTRWPASASARAPAGVSATRCSPGLISRGTPMITNLLGGDPSQGSPRPLLGGDPSQGSPRPLLGGDPSQGSPRPLLGGDPSQGSPRPLLGGDP